MYRHYPSLLNKLLISKIKTFKPALALDELGIKDSDVEIIKQFIPEKAPVYIYSSRDWAYLTRAKRPPGFPFIPSTAIPLREQGENWLPFQNANIIFLDTAAPLWGNHRMSVAVDKLLKSKFKPIKTGINIRVYKRIV